jgi:hypothetical protein
MTKTNRIKRYLEQGLYCNLVRCNTYKHPLEEGMYYFVGSGSVRKGPCRSRSTSLTGLLVKRMEAWEKTLNA